MPHGYVVKRRPAALAPELFHLASWYEREMTCSRALRWDPADLANLMEPEVLARITGGFSVDHWRVEDRLLAALDVGGLRVPGMVYVRVWHEGVDIVTRRCDRCGTMVGTGV